MLQLQCFYIVIPLLSQDNHNAFAKQWDFYVSFITS